MPPSSTSARDGDRVVALQQRVEQLEHEIGSPARVALGEVVALEQLGDGHGAGQAEQVVHRHVEPLAVAADLGRGRRSSTLNACSWKVAAFASISSPVEHRARAERAGGVAHAGGEVADDQDHEVAGVLELAQLLQHDHVAEVDVGRGRVDAELHPQRPAPRAARRSEGALGQRIDRVALEARGGSGVGAGVGMGANARLSTAR